MTIKLTHENISKIRDMAGSFIAFSYKNGELHYATIQTKIGQITAMVGDNIIKYSNGEIFAFESEGD